MQKTFLSILEATVNTLASMLVFIGFGLSIKVVLGMTVAMFLKNVGIRRVFTHVSEWDTAKTLATIRWRLYRSSLSRESNRKCYIKRNTKFNKELSTLNSKYIKGTFEYKRNLNNLIMKYDTSKLDNTNIKHLKEAIDVQIP